ncbi:antibiotic biosynthesis monooxygenase family protein [Chelatococcus asaccharovorans]|uniref:Antibiotic biosynthesis monooxygenase n=1 Tax=Chelatococcus asaccharovorans TaxID=28210 RepID=A0A2V3U3N2_9HYPH|nr:hypothetical protein [Chelatococcus asaccharovorans]MBS7703036.1 hypothetical protein [Chelatococcus asaccharovorans]PXW57335.1 hypothetical protein C7450_107376 [Chelatococcus asaccharovorans]
MTGIIEIVHFRLTSGSSEEDFLEEAKKASRFLQSCQGFVRRHLSKGGDGAWIDHVEWTDMEAARAAADALMKAPSLAAFIAAIDASSAVMAHNRLMLMAE